MLKYVDTSSKKDYRIAHEEHGYKFIEEFYRTETELFVNKYRNLQFEGNERRELSVKEHLVWIRNEYKINKFNCLIRGGGNSREGRDLTEKNLIHKPRALSRWM